MIHPQILVYVLFNVKSSLFAGRKTACFAAIFYLDKKFSVV